MRLPRLLTPLLVLLLAGCVHLKALDVRMQAEQLYKEGRTTEIIPLVEGAMAEVERDLGPNHPYMGEAHNALAVLYAYTINDFERSLEHFRRALAIRTETLGPEHPDTLETVNLMGFLYQVTGDSAKAEAHFREALRLREKVLGPDHPDTADTQVYLGGLYLTQARYREAEALLRQAAKNEAQAVSTRYPSPADAFANLGALYFSLGDYEESERYHRQALAVRERELGPDHSIVASSVDSIGFIDQHQQRFDEAERHFTRALRIKEQAFGRFHGFTGDSLVMLGHLARDRGDDATASDYYRQAAEIYERVLGEENYRFLIALASLAVVDFKRGDYAAAQARCERVLASPGVAAIGEMQWQVQILYSMVLGKTGQTNAAIFFGKEGVNRIQTVRADISGMSQELQKGFLTRREPAFKWLASLLIEQGRLPEAQQVLRMLKEEEHLGLVRRAARDRDTRKTSTAYTPVEQPWVERYRSVSHKLAAIGEEMDQLKRRKKLGLDEEEAARLAQAQGDLKLAKKAFLGFLGDLRRELEQVTPQRAAEIGRKNLGQMKAMQGTLRAMGGKTALMHYLVTDDRLYLILTTPRVQLVRQVDITAAALHHGVFRLRRALQNPGKDPREEAGAMYRLLFEPVAEDLRQAGTDTLMVSMDGALRYLPIAALHDGERYLAQRLRTVLFTEAAQTKLLMETPADWEVAGLGLTRAVMDHGELPAVKRELESIVREGPDDPEGVLPGLVRLDQDFNWQVMVDVLDAEYPVLHIASHFVFTPGAQQDSYLVLGDGTALTLERILEEDMDFNGVDLLTLSACETAMGGPSADGREIEGFGWLAQRQGAKAVLATLWAVADESTGEFMRELYRLRQQEGLSKAAALQEAQIGFIESRRYGHPFFWAPFILMGNWL